MNIFEAVLHSHTDEDLLCVPGICLGSRPTESCVVLGVPGNRVESCAHADLDWLDEGGGDLIRQVEAAARPVRSCSFVILGYTEGPGGNCGRLIRLVLEPRGKVTDILMATPGRYWVVTPLGLEPPDGRSRDLSTTSLSAEAVYLGIPIATNRAKVIAEVRPLDEPEEAEFFTESALEHASGLGDEQRGELAERLPDCEEPLSPIGGAQLAVLVSDPGVAGIVVANLNHEGAARVRPRIAYARRMCGDSYAPEMLALLSLVCWFDNQGAQQTECLEQPERLTPGHRLLPLLRGLKALAMKPPFSFPTGMEDHQGKGMCLVVCGEALIDLLPGERVSSAEIRWSALYGGSPMSTALGLARLREDNHSLGCLGGDAFGRQIERYLQDNGAATDLVVRMGEPTSVAVVSLDAEGRASCTFHFQNTSGFGWRAGEFPELRESDWLHFRSIGTISRPGARAVLNFVRSTPASLSYDINVRPTVLPDHVEYFQRVEQLIVTVGAGGGIIKASDEDICWLVGDPDPLPYAEAWRIEYGLALYVVTLGPDGVVAIRPDGRQFRVPGHTVEMADTVGAGDIFMSGFLASYIRCPDDVDRTLRWGAGASVLVCTKQGASPPTHAKLEEFLASPRKKID